MDELLALISSSSLTMTPALDSFWRSSTVCSLDTSDPKFGFLFNCRCNQSSASLAVKQSSYVRKCFRCFFLGIPSCNDFTMLFQSRVALQGPSSTKLLSMFCFLLVLFTFQ